ncbi:zinc finger protein 276 isoform X1 [Ochotona princeps]|nr:zinc finger protein 276 isoform X1 [Ochotona princeps]XP_058529986.1 zinc finger protein 276 isoform X1 [Ochotona princeps]
MGHCRLCHGKFSSRSLRSITDRSPGEGPERSCPGQRVFIKDFQRLLGVAVHQDPALSEFVCRNCHAQFYQCHSLLESFLQRVNVSPMGQQKLCPKVGAQPPTGLEEAVFPGDRITSSSWCLHGLVGWVHGHAGSCSALPSLQRTLASEYCGIIQAVWGCDQGHTYTMDTDASCRALLLDSSLSVKWAWDKEMASSPSGTGLQVSQARGTTVGVETKTLPSMEVAPPPPDGNPMGPGPGPPPQPSPRLSGAPGGAHRTRQEPFRAPWRAADSAGGTRESKGRQSACLPLVLRRQDPASAICTRHVRPGSWVRSRFRLQPRMIGDFLSEDENNKNEHSQSSDTHTEPPPEKKVSSRKSESREDTKAEEPKIRKKPGPKPGWKKQLRCEREELPTIYKCPYQGCTAVYRGADGMKKHIKEHHEEVRERPCPHPGCNKVFMIDRYLQRHIKLIHTEVRNYICDECGQTFKQRKHLLVHKMRHSGAKPLQCEVCGFQCRQRASLKYHMTKHKAETELDFACDQCGRRFEKAHNLNVHMSMVHPLTQTQGKAEPPPAPPDPSGTKEGQTVKPEPT